MPRLYRRVSAFLHLEYVLRWLHRDVARAAGLKVPEAVRQPTDAMDETELDRVEQAFESIMTSGAWDASVLSAIEHFGEKNRTSRRRTLQENLARLAWDVVQGIESPARAIYVARVWGSSGRLVGLESVLERRHRETEVRVTQVYQALAEGTPAETRAKQQKEGRGGHYMGSRGELRRIILAEGRRRRPFANDTRTSPNVTNMTAISGSQCPTPDVSSDAKKALPRRKVSKKK